MKLTKFNKIAYLPILAFLSISNIASACDSTAADCPALVRASEMREMAKGRFVWVKGGNSYLTAVDTHAAHNIGVALGDKEMGSYAPINDKTERHGTWNVCKYMGGNGIDEIWLDLHKVTFPTMTWRDIRRMKAREEVFSGFKFAVEREDVPGIFDSDDKTAELQQLTDNKTVSKLSFNKNDLVIAKHTHAGSNGNGKQIYNVLTPDRKLILIDFSLTYHPVVDLK